MFPYHAQHKGTIIHILVLSSPRPLHPRSSSELMRGHSGGGVSCVPRRDGYYRYRITVLGIDDDVGLRLYPLPSRDAFTTSSLSGCTGRHGELMPPPPSSSSSSSSASASLDQGRAGQVGCWLLGSWLFLFGSLDLHHHCRRSVAKKYTPLSPLSLLNGLN